MQLVAGIGRVAKAVRINQTGLITVGYGNASQIVFGIGTLAIAIDNRSSYAPLFILAMY